MDLPRSDADGRGPEDDDATVTLKFDAAAMRSSMESYAKMVAGLQRTAASLESFQRQVEATAETLAQASRRTARILERNEEVWSTAARRAQQISESLRPALESSQEFALTLDAPALELARKIARSRTQLRPILASSLQTSVAAVAAADAEAAADRILDEASRASAAASDADGLAWLVGWAAAAAQRFDLTRAEKIALLSLVITLGIAWCTYVDHARLGADHAALESEHARTQEQVADVDADVAELREVVTDRLDALYEQVESDEGDACRGPTDTE